MFIAPDWKLECLRNNFLHLEWVIFLDRKNMFTAKWLRMGSPLNMMCIYVCILCVHCWKRILFDAALVLCLSASSKCLRVNIKFNYFLSCPLLNIFGSLQFLSLFPWIPLICLSFPSMILFSFFHFPCQILCHSFSVSFIFTQCLLSFFWLKLLPYVEGMLSVLPVDFFRALYSYVTYYWVSRYRFVSNTLP